MNKPINIKELIPYSQKQNSASGKGVSFFDRIKKIMTVDLSLTGTRLPDKIKEDFYIELSSLISSGVDVRTALEIIVEQQSKVKYKLIFDKILQEIISGKPLSEALRSMEFFSPYECFTIAIGEETGRLKEVLTELTHYFRRRILQRRQILGALTYPALVIFVAVSALGFMITFVVPMFSDIFKRYGGDLPFITKIVITLSNKAAGWFLFLVFSLVAIFIFIRSQRKADWFRKKSSAVVLSMPVIGSLIRDIYLLRTVSALALLLKAQIPIVKAVQLSRKMISFYPIEIMLKEIEENLIKGDTLYDSLKDHPIVSKKIRALLKVGEETNQLGYFFNKIAQNLSEEIEYRTAVMGKLLEPIIILMLGLIVGVVLVAMYLPLFKLGQAF